jgi:hypothetical protein
VKGRHDWPLHYSSSHIRALLYWRVADKYVLETSLKNGGYL